MSCSIPLRNKYKEIVDYTIVGEEDYKELSKYKWYNSNGYAQSKINTKSWLLHRYIMIKILKNDISHKVPIDHIDNNPLNNTRDNLRIVTYSENARNRVKKENASSQYIGVSLLPSNKWKVQIRIDKKQLFASYDNEHHAGHQYNLWCNQYNLFTAPLNIIPDELLVDFIQHKPREKLNDLPQNIRLTKYGKYQVRINCKHYGYYNTLEDAIKVKENVLNEIETNKLNSILSKPILRNESGDCVINITSNNVDYEMLVDEDNYYDLMQYGISFTGGYAKNGKLGYIHRYIMNYSEEHYIDHINGNKLDNRKSNLRLATSQQNNMNRSSGVNSTSQYIGVSFDTRSGKYIAKINGKHIGIFENEINAAKARDGAAKELHDGFHKLNFTDE